MKKFFVMLVSMLICCCAFTVSSCGSDKGTPSGTGDGSGDSTIVDTYETVEEILQAAQELKKGEALSQEVELEGTISSIVNQYNDSLKAITISMKVEDVEIYASRLRGNGVDEFIKGYLVKVKGTISRTEDGYLQFNEGCVVLSYEARTPERTSNGFVAEDLGLQTFDPFTSYSEGVVTFTAAQNDGAEAPFYHIVCKTLRFSYKTSLTISVQEGYTITSITVEVAQEYINEDTNCFILNGRATSGNGTSVVVITPDDGTEDIVLTCTAENGQFWIGKIVAECEKI